VPRPLAFALALSVVAVAAAAAVPVSEVGVSGDPWEGRISWQCREAQVRVENVYVRPAAAARRGQAVRLLESASVVAPGEAEAAALLGMARRGRGSLAARYLDARIAGQDAARRAVFERRTGSWSRADQMVLDDMKAIRAGPRMRRMRFYLARGLVQPPYEQGFSLHICGTTLVVAQFSLRADSRRRPARVPVIALLERPPRAAHVTWLVSVPGAH
jgi:hypothetical protein